MTKFEYLSIADKFLIKQGTVGDILHNKKWKIKEHYKFNNGVLVLSK